LFLRLFLLFLFVSQVAAQQIPLTNALSFAPPPTDRSIQFLSNIFGVVDGVLAGTGSQIFGNMMSIFNAAVLALGSIVIMYTLMIGTMNTAHEGEFLGRKWSSVWIPLRCSAGMVLIIPKASGYCIMQVFMMWVVVQGVGAADRIWNTALEYLNRGGKIVQTQMGSQQILHAIVAKQDPTFIGASAILTGQVCMAGTQKALENARDKYLNWANEHQMGPCYEPTDVNWKMFCENPVPNFLDSINPILFQKSKEGWLKASTYHLPMPNFDAQSIPAIYTKMNGMCGAIHWNDVTNLSLEQSQLKNLMFTDEQIESFGMSRAIAIAQIYDNLRIVSSAIIENNPKISSNPSIANSASTSANLQFGVAQNDLGETCHEYQEAALCSFWQTAKDRPQAGVLFSGNEFLNSIAAYEGLMMPIINMAHEIKNEDKFKKVRNFIGQTKQSGWMFAGAYFFNLVNLTGPVSKVSLTKDLNSGMDGSQFYQIQHCQSHQHSSPGELCWFLEPIISQRQDDLRILEMIQGAGAKGGDLDCKETLSFSSPGAFQVSQGYIQPQGAFSDGACSSTVLGLIGNSYFFHLPSQAGLNQMTLPDFPMMFAKVMPPVDFKEQNAPCLNKVEFAGIKWCTGNFFSGGLSWFFQQVVGTAIQTINSLMGLAVNILIVVPLKVCVWPQMQYAMQVLSNLSNNPIVDLANMGASFIQSTLYSYLGTLAVSGLGSFPMMGSVILILLAFLGPLYTAWLSYFVSIGFTTCYYIPLLPYLIFTFGVIAWLFTVIEAMVAAPIMALGVTTPEGEGILGKGEHGVLLLVNVFLRPSMMVIGFITAIALTYICIWVLNAGFDIAAGFLKVQSSEVAKAGMGYDNIYGIQWGDFPFAQLLGCMFYVVIYIGLYLTIIQKSFTLIFLLPDKVLRWIGGHPETIGSETQQWFQEGAQKLDHFGQMTDKGITSGLGDISKKIGDVVMPKANTQNQSLPNAGVGSL